MVAKKVELTEDEQAGFDKCWAVYRKSNGKGQAMVTWKKWGFKGEQVEEIFEAILAQNKAGDRYCEKRFLRHFSTWLNDMGWKDEIPSAQAEYNPAQHKCTFCTNPVEIKSTLCHTCTTKYQAEHKEERKQFFIERGVYKKGMSEAEFITSCKDYINQMLPRIGK